MGREQRLGWAGGPDDAALIAALRQWLCESCGGEVHPALHFGEAPPPPLGCGAGIGAVATAPIARGELLLRIPDPAVVTVDSVFQDPELGGILRHAAGRTELSGIAAVHVWLARQRMRGPKSRWAAYIAALPARPALPFLYGEDLLNALRPSSAFISLERCGMEMQKEYNTVVVPMRRACPELLGELDYKNQYVWAVVQCLSRMFAVGGTPALLPVGDLINHRDGGAQFALAEDGSGAVVLHSAADYAAGEEVWVDYGRGGTFASLFHHGFVDPPRGLPAAVGAGMPWWVGVMRDPRAAGPEERFHLKGDPAETLVASLPDDELLLLLSECVPSQEGVTEGGEEWGQLEVPGWFVGDVEVEHPQRTVQLCRGVAKTGGPQMDTVKWTVGFRQRPAEPPEFPEAAVLPTAEGLCALRLSYVHSAELEAFGHAAAGSPVGWRSEVLAAAAAAAALRTRIGKLASALGGVVRRLGLRVDGDGAWSWAGPPPADAAALTAIGAALTCDMVLAQRALEAASAVPGKYSCVSTGRPMHCSWGT